MMKINNQLISNHVKRSYSLQELKELYCLCENHKVFSFPSLANGLFPAANLDESSEYTGYSNVWIRDNIYIAYAHYINGHIDIATKNIKTLASFFIKYKWRLEKIISNELDYNIPMNRPHIRFDGEGLEELKQKWAHAENDAMGYFLWFFCKLCNDGTLEMSSQYRELLTLIVLYLNKIRYWEDEDSGHWEETLKIEASSIGVVVSALLEFKTLAQINNYIGFSFSKEHISSNWLDTLIYNGNSSLHKILPAECIQDDPSKNRPYDAALLFLIFPMNITTEKTSLDIFKNVVNHLQGDHGIRRYLGDSYWASDYKMKLDPDERTVDFSDDLSIRDSFHTLGQEAQWCIFDPIMSVICGQKYKKTYAQRWLNKQVYYLNRSLGQLTSKSHPQGGFKCPELYYLENGDYIPNDNVPLLWTQANLWMAFKFLKDSLELKTGR